MSDRELLRVANCSGYFGDRLGAAAEMIEGGPIDVLTGDYLAELTMLILWKNGQRSGGFGYARTFLTQMEEVLGRCLDRGIKVVVNAGGLDPAGMAARLAELAETLGLAPRIAWLEGDDLLPRLPELYAAGEQLLHLATGASLQGSGITPVTANAYIGGWGIAEALRAGADVVIAGRTTDAALVVGPAAWAFEWATDDWDRLAGAVAAGHILECGTQATGGNFSFFTEIEDMIHPGFPIAEIEPDGSSVITKHPGTGGAVTVDTVTAQLLYEIGAPAYLNPDVVTHFDSLHLTQLGRDRVALSGVHGSPPPDTLKVCVNFEGGHRNTVSFGLTGDDVDAKADLALRGFLSHFAAGAQPQTVEHRVVHADAGATVNADAVSRLVITCKDADPKAISRPVFDAANQLALASYPGMFLTEAGRSASAFGVYWPATVARDQVPVRAVFADGTTIDAPEPPRTLDWPAQPQATDEPAAMADDATVTLPLGRLIGARSGDKGGDANIGVWARATEAYDWIRAVLDVPMLQQLLPETAELSIERYDLPNLNALNFLVRDILDDGVAATSRPDPQAKGLGEFLRSRQVTVPAAVAKSVGVEAGSGS